MLHLFLKLSIVMLDLLECSIFFFFSVNSNCVVITLKDQFSHLWLDPSHLLHLWPKPEDHLFLGVLRLVLLRTHHCIKKIVFLHLVLMYISPDCIQVVEICCFCMSWVCCVSDNISWSKSLFLSGNWYYGFSALFSLLTYGIDQVFLVFFFFFSFPKIFLINICIFITLYVQSHSSTCGYFLSSLKGW